MLCYSWTILPKYQGFALSEQLPTHSLKAACFLTLVPEHPLVASFYLIGPLPEEVLYCQTWQVRTHVYKSAASSVNSRGFVPESASIWARLKLPFQLADV